MADLLDINVWIAFAFENHEHHAVVNSYFSNIPEQGAAFCRLTELGFLRLATNKIVAQSHVLTLPQAWDAYDELRKDGRVIFMTEPVNLEFEFRKLTQSGAVSRNTWTDAYLASFAIASGMRMVSLDRGFASFSGLDSLILSK